jgi:nucleoside-diphosphate kinase
VHRPSALGYFRFEDRSLMAGHHGAIIQDIINHGYKIRDAELLHLDRQNAEEFLEVYKGVAPEYHVI